MYTSHTTFSLAGLFIVFQTTFTLGPFIVLQTQRSASLDYLLFSLAGLFIVFQTQRSLLDRSYFGPFNVLSDTTFSLAGPFIVQC